MRRKVRCKEMRDVAFENLQGFVIKSNMANEKAAKRPADDTRKSAQVAILGHPLEPRPESHNLRAG